MSTPKLREYLVKPGDCLASIAAQLRATLESIWELPENAELRGKRRDPWVLAPGDKLLVPEPVPTTFKLAAGKQHTFRHHDVYTEFQVTVRVNGRPRANIGFSIHLEGRVNPIEGTTDDKGVVRARIPATSRRGRIAFEDGRGRVRFELGMLDPIDTVAGVQARLRDLGFYYAKLDGKLGPYTTAALRAFQRALELPVTGEPDEPTQAGLRKEYGR